MADFQDFAGLSEFLEALKSVRKPPKAIHVNKQLKAMRPESLDAELLRQAKKINFMQRQAFGLKSDLKAFPGRNKKNSEEIQQNNQRLKTLEEKSAAFDANTTQIDIQKQFNAATDRLERFAEDFDINQHLSATNPEAHKAYCLLLAIQAKSADLLDDQLRSNEYRLDQMFGQLRREARLFDHHGGLRRDRLVEAIKKLPRLPEK